MRVTNLKGTSDEKCNCSSWLEHWQRYGGNNEVRLCSVLRCKEAMEVGAHVKDTYRREGLVPLCQKHNKSTEELDVGSVALVSASVVGTCMKKRA